MATPKDELIFHGVRVIEALADTDQRTAHRLYHDVLLPTSHRNPSVHVSFDRTDTRTALLECLSDTGMDVAKTGRNPILHIEAHGNKLGLVMPNGDLVRWAVLADLLREINRLTGFNLLLVLGACHGAHFTETLLPTKPAPVWAVIGPQETVFDADLLHSYRVFYGELLEHFDGTKALQATMDAAPGGLRDFSVFTALFVFKVAFQRIAIHAADREAVQARSERKVREILAERPDLLDRRQEILDEVVTKASNPSESFDECRASYFMYDQVPSNRARFPVEFAECINSET